MPFDGVTWPDIHVSAQFGGPAAPSGNTLVLSVGPGLDTCTLGGAAWWDITNDVDSAVIARGPDSDVDVASPGTCTLVMDNFSGDYDPTNLNGRFVSGGVSLVDIGVAVQVSAEFPVGTVYQRYLGTIADINVDASYTPKVTFTCTDGLETLGRAKLTATTPSFDGDTTGVRVGHLADQAAWPSSYRALDAGASTLGTTTLGDFTLLLMQQVERTEFGRLWVDGAGNLTFYDRYHASTAIRSITAQAAFSDGGPVNVLTATQSGFEDATTTGWVALSNVTLSSVTTQAHSGTRSMLMQSVAGGNVVARVDPSYQAHVSPGITYTCSAWFRTAVSGRTCRCHFDWFDTNGAFISSSADTVTPTDTTTGWVQASSTGVAPVGTVSAAVVVQYDSAGAGSEQHYVDDVSATGGEIEMTTLDVAKSRDRTFNDWHITRLATTPNDVPVEQVATDANSATTYGTLSGPSGFGELCRSDAEALAMAQGLITRAPTPQIRVRSVVADVLTQGLWPTVLRLGLLDRVVVSRNYGPNTITAQLWIQAMREEITFNPDAAWVVTFSTTNPFPAPGLFILDTSVLDTGVLGW